MAHSSNITFISKTRSIVSSKTDLHLARIQCRSPNKVPQAAMVKAAQVNNNNNKE